MTDWQDMEMRAVYAQTLDDLMEADPNVLCLEADLSKASGTNPAIRDGRPDNYVNCGVSEAHMIGLAAGLANEGKIPFCATFSCFASRRVYDQIYISAAYANNNVKIVGTAPGITQGPNGGTHMEFGDLALMRAMPNLHVYSPVDPLELRAVMRHMATHSQPTYMQLVRPKVRPVHTSAVDFDPERALRLHAGEDVTLVSTGYMTRFALDVAQALAGEGVGVDLLHYPSVKPFDAETLTASAARTGAVVTVENGNIIGGLGGAVCETLCETRPVPVKRLGVPDRFGEVATEAYLFRRHGFGPEEIAAACRELAQTGKAVTA